MLLRLIDEEKPMLTLQRRLLNSLPLYFCAAIVFIAIASIVMAQAPAQNGRGGGRGVGRGGAPQVQVTSPEITADHHVTFRIVAPQAQAIRLAASDIPNLGQTATLTK